MHMVRIRGCSAEADGRCLGRDFFICDHTYAAVVYRAGECRISERNAAGKSLVGKGDRLQHDMIMVLCFFGNQPSSVCIAEC